MDFLDTAPEVFDGLVWVPGDGAEGIVVTLDFFWLIGSVGYLKVGQHFEDRDIEITVVGILKDGEVTG